jgi:tetratricopeptide (TPR) repeat protein
MDNKYDSYITQGYFLMEHMKNEQACAAWRQAIELDPKRYEAYVWLADNEAHYGEGPDIAYDIIKEGLKHNPDNAYLHVVAAITLQMLFTEFWIEKEYINHLKKAIKAQPSWPHPRLMLIYTLKEGGNYSKAKTELSRLKASQKPFIPKSDMEDYLEYTFTGRTNHELDEVINIYLREIDEQR